MEKTHWKKLTHPDYIGAYELMDGSDKAKEIVVIINEVKREVITGADGKKEECTVAHLRGQKPMILNATNQKAITKAMGSPYIQDWFGRPITLYVAKVKAFGETVDALRVRDKAPVVTLPELSPSHPKWNDAKKAVAAGNTNVDAIREKYLLTVENEKLLCSESDVQPLAQ